MNKIRLTLPVHSDKDFFQRTDEMCVILPVGSRWAWDIAESE